MAYTEKVNFLVINIENQIFVYIVKNGTINRSMKMLALRSSYLTEILVEAAVGS